ncbi:MAG: hypothetical protein IJM78_01780 [Prevotella sp.]|nr:hypothetical protein [Prevotella sp.]
MEMEFLMITIGALVVLAVIAAIASRFDKGSDEIVTAGGCDDCTGREDCKLLELKKQCGKKVER